MMTRDINLNSHEWCELVFEGKNKSYGAYTIRNESSNRHLKALLITGALGISIVSGITLRDRYNAAHGLNPNDVDGTVKITQFDMPEKVVVPKDEVKTEPEAKPIAKSIAYTPPTIVTDDKAPAEDPPTQDILTLNRDAIIAGVTRNGVTDGTGEVATSNTPIETATTITEVFEHVEQMPAFPGGNSELMSFLGKNIKYPVIAQEQGIQGTVTLRFIVDTDGSISNVEILKSLDVSCDREAKRVISSMPKWIPGKQNGKAVKVFYTVPVRFRLAS